jgi:hypothetical protein
LRSRRPNLGFDRSSLILGNFPYYRFMFFTWTLPSPPVLEFFWVNSWRKHVSMSSLANNLGLKCINNTYSCI